jgi:hypothetical protein
MKLNDIDTSRYIELVVMRYVFVILLLLIIILLK